MTLWIYTVWIHSVILWLISCAFTCSMTPEGHSTALWMKPHSHFPAAPPVRMGSQARPEGRRGVMTQWNNCICKVIASLGVQQTQKFNSSAIKSTLRRRKSTELNEYSLTQCPWFDWLWGLRGKRGCCVGVYDSSCRILQMIQNQRKHRNRYKVY